MNILFLGPPCPSIEAYFSRENHSVVRTEERLQSVWLREQSFDFALSYRYKHIIRQDVIDYFARKLINMHISLLPWNRGVDPNFWSHIENTPKGVTIHRVDAGLDTGDILLQQEVFFDMQTDTLRTSYDVLSSTIEKLFIDNADALLANSISAVPQNGKGSFHRAKDKLPYMRFFDESGLNMQICKIIQEINVMGGGG